MPRFVYDPADTHKNNELHVNKRRVSVGVPFEYDGNPLDDPKIAAHVARVPGRVVAGERRPCIVAVDAPAFIPPTGRADEVPGSAAALLRLLGLPPESNSVDALGAIQTMRDGLNTIAKLVELPAGAPVVEVVERVKTIRAGAVARLRDAVGLPTSARVSDVVDEVLARLSARPVLATLDPNISGPVEPGALTGPPGDSIRPILPGEAADPVVVDTDAMGITEPRRQYDLADLPETNAGLEKLAADNSVELKSGDKRNRETRIAALRAAGLVAEG